MDPDPMPASATHRSLAELAGLATDAAIGAGVEATQLAWRGLGVLGRTARPVTALLPRPPLPAVAVRPEAWLRQAAERGRRARAAGEHEISELAGTLLPRIVAAVLDRLDLTAIVLDYVDLDGVVAAVDLNDAVARVDVDAIAASIDIDAIADRIDIARIIRRVDIDAIAASIDIDAIADRIDIARIIRRVDIDAIAASIDIDAIVDRVDVDEVAARLDMDAVIDRIDLIGIARYIVDALDLPEIIRQSTGMMTSDAVREVRMQGIQADELVGRAVDRLLLRHKARRTDVGGLTATPEAIAPETVTTETVTPETVTPDGDIVLPPVDSPTRTWDGDHDHR